MVFYKEVVMTEKLSAAMIVAKLMECARNCDYSDQSCGPLCVSRLAYKSVLFSKALDGLFRFSGSDCKELKKNDVTDIEFLDGSSVKVLVNAKGEVEDVVCEKKEATKEVSKCDDKGSLFLFYYSDCARVLKNNGSVCRSQQEKAFFSSNFPSRNRGERRSGA